MTHDRRRTAARGPTRRAILSRTARGLALLGASGLAAVTARGARARAAGKDDMASSPRFTDNGATITDHRTGLMWEKKRDSAQADWRRDPHSVDAVCTWTEATGEWIRAVNASAHAGFSDWRLPDAHELASIIDYTQPKPPAIDPIFGPVAAAFYWSATPLAFRPGLAWDVFFLDGVVFVDDQGNGNRVRAVRTIA